MYCQNSGLTMESNLFPFLISFVRILTMNRSEVLPQTFYLSAMLHTPNKMAALTITGEQQQIEKKKTIISKTNSRIMRTLEMRDRSQCIMEILNEIDEHGLSRASYKSSRRSI